MAGNEGVPVLARKALEPSGPQIGGDAGGQPPGDLTGQQILVRRPPLQQGRHGEAGASGVQIVPVGHPLQQGEPASLIQEVVVQLQSVQTVDGLCDSGCGLGVADTGVLQRQAGPQVKLLQQRDYRRSVELPQAAVAYNKEIGRASCRDRVLRLV